MFEIAYSYQRLGEYTTTTRGSRHLGNKGNSSGRMERENYDKGRKEKSDYFIQRKEDNVSVKFKKNPC